MKYHTAAGSRGRDVAAVRQCGNRQAAIAQTAEHASTSLPINSIIRWNCLPRIPCSRASRETGTDRTLPSFPIFATKVPLQMTLHWRGDSVWRCCKRLRFPWVHSVCFWLLSEAAQGRQGQLYNRDRSVPACGFVAYMVRIAPLWERSGG